MTTVPNQPEEVRADRIHPGAILPLATDDPATDGGLHEVAAVTPYTDGDGDRMIALTVKPLGVGDPEVVRFLAGFKLELATDAEIAEHRDAGSRRVLADALVDLAEQICNKRLPVPPYRLSVGGCVDTFGDLEQWAEHLGVEIREGGTDGSIPVVNKSVVVPGGPELDIHFQAGEFPADYKTSAEASSPSAAGAEGGTGPAAPSGPGAEATPGPDTTTAAEGDNSTTSADASGETGSKGPVDRVAAAPVAPRGMGATGVTPDPHADCGFNGGKQVTCDRCGKTYVCTPSTDYYCAAEGDHCCEPCLLTGVGVPVLRVNDAPEVATDRPTCDLQPTCIFSSPQGRREFHEKYAASLDKSNPGWHWRDTDHMSSELAAEAQRRRQADTTERPYRCEGCGKTSRITPHEPGCPVDAAWLARNGKADQ